MWLIRPRLQVGEPCCTNRNNRGVSCPVLTGAERSSTACTHSQSTEERFRHFKWKHLCGQTTALVVKTFIKCGTWKQAGRHLNQWLYCMCCHISKDKVKQLTLLSDCSLVWNAVRSLRHSPAHTNTHRLKV